MSQEDWSSYGNWHLFAELRLKVIESISQVFSPPLDLLGHKEDLKLLKITPPPTVEPNWLKSVGNGLRNWFNNFKTSISKWKLLWGSRGKAFTARGYKALKITISAGIQSSWDANYPWQISLKLTNTFSNTLRGTATENLNFFSPSVHEDQLYEDGQV